MQWRDFEPARMQRVAVVAPVDRLRRVLIEIAAAGVVELERIDVRGQGPATDAFERTRRRLSGDSTSAEPVLDAVPVAISSLERDGRLGELAGEAELEKALTAALRHGSVAALVGWSPLSTVGSLATRVEALGGAVVSLAAPRWVEPPTLIAATGATRAFQPLVDTYSTIDYRDLNPSALAGIAYVVMFGMMFGDVGHGLIVLAGGLLLLSGRPASLARVRRVAPFVVGAGIASIVFGLAYGEMFGPTKLVPTLWLSPLDHATTLLAVAVTVGAVLLAVSYVLGTANRWREGGAARALLAMSGFAGAALYLGLALVFLGWRLHSEPLELVGGLTAAAGLGSGFLGLYLEAGGRASGFVQSSVELFDGVLRIGTNTVSFARLAAFGLTHAALEGVTWRATTVLWHKGALLAILGIALFAIGNIVAFSLEGLVAAIQALRLEYYELFSRIFVSEGRKFRPWHLPVNFSKEATCSLG